jgi:hypothetical protein
MLPRRLGARFYGVISRQALQVDSRHALRRECAQYTSTPRSTQWCLCARRDTQVQCVVPVVGAPFFGANADTLRASPRRRPFLFRLSVCATCNYHCVAGLRSVSGLCFCLLWLSLLPPRNSLTLTRTAAVCTLWLYLIVAGTPATGTASVSASRTHSLSRSSVCLQGVACNSPRCPSRTVHSLTHLVHDSVAPCAHHRHPVRDLACAVAPADGVGRPD